MWTIAHLSLRLLFALLKICRLRVRLFGLCCGCLTSGCLATTVNPTRNACSWFAIALSGE